jgi:hypothetical protein
VAAKTTLDFKETVFATGELFIVVLRQLHIELAEIPTAENVFQKHRYAEDQQWISNL